MLTAEQLAEAQTAALAALAAAGVPPEQVVLGFTNAEGDEHGDVEYETYVGATHNADVALLLELVARDLTAEAHRAAMGVYRGKPCPDCESPRYALCRELDETGSRYRVHMFDECMDCGHRGPRL